MASIGLEHLDEIGGWVDFEIDIVAWLLQDDHFEVGVAVIAAAVHTIVVNLVLVDFHDLFDTPIKRRK